MDKNFCFVSIYSEYSKQVAFNLEDGDIKPSENGNVLIQVDKTLDNFFDLVDFRISFDTHQDCYEFYLNYERISHIEFYAQKIKRFTDDEE